MNPLFDEWAARYARGESPNPVEYLERAGAEADELAKLMNAFLRAAPRAEPTEETLALTRAWVSGASPLAELRAGRGIRRDDVVDAVMSEFAFDLTRRSKVQRYYHELESGLLDPAGLDSRLTKLLERILGATRATVLGWKPRPLAGGYARASEAISLDAKRLVNLDDSDDEVDRLFRSAR